MSDRFNLLLLSSVRLVLVARLREKVLLGCFIICMYDLDLLHSAYHTE